MSISRYQTYAATIQPGELFTINRAGRSVTCFEASAGLEIVIDDGSSSAFFAGVSVDFDYEFKRIQLLNPNDTAVTFQIATAMGKVDDNRLTVSTALQVAGISDPVKIVDENGYLSSLSNGFYEVPQYEAWAKVPKHKIGTSFMSIEDATNVASMFVDPSANSNGVIIRSIAGANTAGNAVSIYADTAPPSNWIDTTKRKIFQFYGSQTAAQNLFDPIFLPVGMGIYAIANGAGAGPVAITWDYL